MTRQVTAVIVAVLVAFGPCETLFAQRTRGSVSGASRGTYSRSGNTGSWSGAGGNASGSRTVSQTSSGYDINKQLQTQGGYSKDVNRDVNTQEGSVSRSSTATNPWGQSASRDRTATNEGGYASVSGSASTSTGRYATGQGDVGRNAWGQPAYAGSVNTKYNGSYASAGARNPYGGWTTATAGPYGGKVTTTLPSGYRTTTYYGRPYYSYGGVYYRPYTYGGVHYYYPVPPPYYCYYSSPPIGAMMIMVAGVAYLAAKDGSYSKQTTNSNGTVVYQSVPAPVGAKITVLPASRVLVTVSGMTYYLASNAFYRRLVSGAQEEFVVVTAPAGTVFVAVLPADFQVVQLNTMYFKAQGRYYVPYLSAEGQEMYVMVDPPPQPPASPGTTSPDATAAPASAAGAPAAAVRTVEETLVVPAGTLLIVRLASDMSASNASVGDRFRAFLDMDLVADGRMVTPRGSKAYGIVSAVDRRHGTLILALTDLTVGDRVLGVATQPFTAPGNPASVAAQTPQAFTLAGPLRVDVMTSVAVR